MVNQMADLPAVEVSSGQEWQSRFLHLELILANQLADLLVQSSNYRFLLLDLILGDELADLTPSLRGI